MDILLVRKIQSKRETIIGNHRILLCALQSIICSVISAIPILYKSLSNCLCLFQLKRPIMEVVALDAFYLICLQYLPQFILFYVISFNTQSKLCSWISSTRLPSDTFWAMAIAQNESYSLTFYFQQMEFQSARFRTPSSITPLSNKLFAIWTASILGWVFIFIRANCKAFYILAFPTTFCICRGIDSLQLVADTIKPRLKIETLSFGS